MNEEQPSTGEVGVGEHVNWRAVEGGKSSRHWEC